MAKKTVLFKCKTLIIFKTNCNKIVLKNSEIIKLYGLLSL